MVKKTETTQEPSNRHKVIALVIALLICFIGICSFLYARSNSPEEIKSRVAAIDANKDLSREERGEQKREYMRGLSDGDQKAMRDERFNEWRKRENDRLEAFYKKSKPEQKKELREEIARQEQRRKEREAWMAANGINPQGGQGQNGQNGQNGAQNASGGPGGRRGGDADSRQQRRDQFLQLLSPEERAQRDQYRYQINHERVSMGLPPLGGGRGGFGGGPRGIGGPPR
jgi:hypothetical protein